MSKVTGQLRSAMDKARKQALEEHGVKANHQLPLDAITLPGTQPRRYFDPESMKRLTDSVRQHGVLQPLLVRPCDGGFELVAGERRYRAAREAGLATVPVAVREMSDREAGEIALLENLQREDLNPVEETEGILQLLAARLERNVQEVVSLLHKMHNEARGRVTHNVMGNETETVTETFERLGTMTWESFVKNRLPLLKLPEDVLTAVKEGQLAYTKARELARIKDDRERSELLRRVLEEDLSLTDIRRMVRKEKEDYSEGGLYIDVARLKRALTARRLENLSIKNRGEAVSLIKQLEQLLKE